MKKVYDSASEALDGLLLDGMLVAAGAASACAGFRSFCWQAIQRCRALRI